MSPLVKQSQRIPSTSLSYYSRLLGRCSSLKSFPVAAAVHAHLIKLGLNRFTFLGNCCLDLYSQLGPVVDDSFRVFEEISIKNVFSWNICVKALAKFGCLETARRLFDEMPERDVVSWNTMMSGYASFGCFYDAFGILREMQDAGVRPCRFTYSIMMSVVDCASHGKELHGSMIRNGLIGSGSLVLRNSVIGMYGRLGAVDYAFVVFLTMEEVDVISWNSVITACCKTGYSELALNQFSSMRSSGYFADEFTCSAAFAACTDLRNLDKDWRIQFGSLKSITNGIQLFDALKLFVLAMREDLRPTEFTLSSILSSMPCLPVPQGTQVHSLVIKLGLGSDTIVTSSLVDMYCKLGQIDSAIIIFNKMSVRDLIAWNAMIMGLARNNRVFDTLNTFNDLRKIGPPPDRITLAGVLLACNYGGLVDEGVMVLSSMEDIYGVAPGSEHYDLVVDLFCRAGRLHQAVEMVAERLKLPCTVHMNLKLAERVAERLIEFHPMSSLPFLVLARIYEMRGDWESSVRIQKAMSRNEMEEVIGYSCIGIKNYIYTFKEDNLQQHGGKDVFLLLRLLDRVMEDIIV
ncbi:hypothetical protein Tsubulata_002082 [Turnera subulata]|uniref:Pentacotripeptide-repeat region of PRORP domain-containing protein n=1 Tax=Turnera subulata TaxID=218843 RepID=A0A9Q0JHV2_9ROSI|nr:hypothetical protein Tsubulata_002082 [Turnera subulata]